MYGKTSARASFKCTRCYASPREPVIGFSCGSHLRPARDRGYSVLDGKESGKRDRRFRRSSGDLGTHATRWVDDPIPCGRPRAKFPTRQHGSVSRSLLCSARGCQGYGTVIRSEQ